MQQKLQKFQDYLNQSSDTYREEYRGYVIRRSPNPEHVHFVLYQDDKRVTTPSTLSSVFTNPDLIKKQIDIVLGKQDKPKSNKNEILIDDRYIIFKTGVGLWKIRMADESLDTPDQLRGQFSDGQYALESIRDYEQNYQGRNNAKKVHQEN